MCIRDRVRRECDQGWQGIEYKLNTVGSSRGDYPFVTVTLGLGTSMFEKMISISLLEVHKNGQGKKGHKKPVLFPKIVFLYDKAIHGEGGIAEDVFEAGLDCSSKTMYPDWLSMSGQGYISSMYKKYKKVIIASEDSLDNICQELENSGLNYCAYIFNGEAHIAIGRATATNIDKLDIDYQTVIECNSKVYKTNNIIGTTTYDSIEDKLYLSLIHISEPTRPY
mgnify:CR=1 FL=1